MKRFFTSLLALGFLWINGYSQVYVDETFETDIPATWTLTSTGPGTAAPWFWNDGTGTQTLNGTGYARVDSDADGNGNHMIEDLESPGFDASAGNIIVLQFEQRYQAASGDSATVQVWDGSEWHNVAVYTSTIGNWNAPDYVTLIISDYINTSGDTKVRFHYDDDDVWAWTWNIDNVLISSVDCLSPLNISIDPGAVAAIVSWDSGSGNSDIVFGPVGVDPDDVAGSGGTQVDDASNPYTITGLDPETEYEVYLRDDCGVDGDSPWAGPFSFTTTIACPNPTLFTSGITDETATSVSISYNQNGLGDMYAVIGPQDFLPGDPLSDTIALTSNPFVITGLDPLTFYSVFVFMDCQGDDLGTSENSGTVSFNTLTDEAGTSCADPFVLSNANMPYTSLGQSICGYGNNVTGSTCNYGGYEEIVYVYAPETADEVLGIYGANSTTESTIYFSITTACPDSAGAECVASGTWSSGSQSTFLLTTADYDLEIGETYYITVSGYTFNGCFLDLQIFLIDCASPSELTSIAGADGTELSWTSTSGAVNYQVEWGLEGFTPGTGTTLDGEYGVDGPPITIDGLSETESYEFYVTDICGIGEQSIPAGPATFTGPPPVNDLCADAIEIECGDELTGNTGSATMQGNPETCGTSVTAPGVWYTFTGTGDDIVLSLCGSDYDTKINLYSGSCDDLVCVGGNDDNFTECGPGNNSYLYASTEEGVTYYVFVGGWLSNVGIFNLSYECITCPLISGLNVSQTDVTASVNWTTTNTGATYNLEYGESGFTQGSGTTLTGTVGTDGPPVGITGLTAGTDYDVYVYEICSPGDTNNTIDVSFTTNLLPPPDNDLCIDAFEISCGGIDSGSTENATQIGNPAGSLCGFATLNSYSVWYEITGNGQLATLSLCGSDFDTELFVFTGSCDSLSCVVSADGNPGTCEWGSSELSFLAEDGVTYYVAVAGWSTFSSGDYVISYECNPCGDPSNLNVSTTDVNATITWDSYLPGAEYTLAYGGEGFDWGSATIVTGSNIIDYPVSLSGLQADSTYQVCVVEYCDAEMANTDTICTTWTTNALPPPSNDDACNAIELVDGDTLETTNIYASTQANEPVPPATGLQTQDGWGNSTLTRSTWYSYTPTSDGMINVSTCHEGSYDTQLAVYAVEDCGDFSTYTLVGANDDMIGGCTSAIFASNVTVCVNADVTYYIQVDPYSTSTTFIGQDFLISLDFTELSVSNVVSFPSPNSAVINWDYVGPVASDFSIIYQNMVTMEYDTVEGNTADLPVTINGTNYDVNYEYTIYCANECGTSSGPYNFIYVTGVDELNFGSNVQLYPNPAHDRLTLEIYTEIEQGTRISLLSMEGKVIYQETIANASSEYRKEFDLSNYSKGMYLFKIENENASIQKRIIIQ